MKTVTAKQVDEKYCCNDNAIVIDVLPKESFEREHIPGAVSIPGKSPDFLERVAKKVKSKTQDIVVYCADSHCMASEDAAEKLEKAGYKSVLRFIGGLKEWKDSGHKVEKAGKTKEKAGAAGSACC